MPKEDNRYTIEAVVDRLISGKMDSARLNDSIELALKHGDGVLTVLLEDGEDIPVEAFCVAKRVNLTDYSVQGKEVILG